MMTVKELAASEEHNSKCRAALSALRDAEEQLAMLNARPADKRKGWKMTVVLGERGYGGREVTTSVEVPFGVVQQQLVDKVRRCRMALAHLGVRA